MSAARPDGRRRAEALLAMGRLDDAASAAREAVAGNPADDAAHALLSRALLLAERCDEALAAAEQGLRARPDSEPLHRARGAALFDAGRHAEALAAADEALRLDPSAAAGHFLRSIALKLLDRLAEAREEAGVAAELDPENADFLTHLGDVWLDEDFARAEEAYRAALRLDPERPWALNNLGVALLRRGRKADASLAFRSALAIDPAFALAKENAFRTAVAIRRGGPASLAAVLALTAAFMVLLVWGLVSGRTWMLVAGFAVEAVQLSALFLMSRAGEKRLASADPQLLELNRRIVADVEQVGLRALRAPPGGAGAARRGRL